MVGKLQDNRRSLKIAVLFLFILLAGSSYLLYQNFETIKLRDEQISSLTNLSEIQEERISELGIRIDTLSSNLSATQQLLENETKTTEQLEQDIINLTMVARSQYSVLAVDETNRGHLIPIEVIIKDGKGNLFLNVANVLFDETLQSSAQTAVRVSREVTRMSLFDKDILINIKAPEEESAIIISGGSGGASIALTVISAMQEKTLKNDVYITGTIREDHTIGKIGGARAKALAAKENGATLFLVPVGQKSDVGLVGIEVREVGTIEEAVKLAIS